MSEITVFQEQSPSNESFWRSIVLFGRNVATYKFALANALLTLSEQDKTQITAEELALPYSEYLCQHLQEVDRQGTSTGSKFLDACREFNNNRISHDQLIATTVKLGFNNVLDAFHVVNGETISNKFFEKQGAGNSSGIILTDNVYRLKEIPFDQNLSLEVEARWRLVETAWNMSVSPAVLQVQHDIATGLLFIEDNQIRRKGITSAKHALNGYQKGKCFYCFDDINISDDETNNCDIDHFIPHILQQYTKVNLNGVWNLVLSCRKCNRGSEGKFARVPATKYLERINKRNNFLVSSNHPLKETIMAQTGMTDDERRLFLKMVDKFAIDNLLFRWETEEQFEAVF